MVQFDRSVDGTEGVHLYTGLHESSLFYPPNLRDWGFTAMYNKRQKNFFKLTVPCIVIQC